jgi:hypothetical protein
VEAAQAKGNAIVSQGLDARRSQLKYIGALEKLAASPPSKVVVFGINPDSVQPPSGDHFTPAP